MYYFAYAENVCVSDELSLTFSQSFFYFFAFILYDILISNNWTDRSENSLCDPQATSDIYIWDLFKHFLSHPPNKLDQRFVQLICLEFIL